MAETIALLYTLAPLTQRLKCICCGMVCPTDELLDMSRDIKRSCGTSSFVFFFHRRPMNYNYSLEASFQSAKRYSSNPSERSTLSSSATQGSLTESFIDLDDITKEFQRYKRMLSSASSSDRELGLREMLDSARADPGCKATPRLSHIHLPSTSESIIKDHARRMARRRSV